MDKKSLKKHHFWILLVLSVPLVFTVLGGTVFGVGSAAVEAKAKIEKRNKELSDAAPKCQQYLDNLDIQKKELEKQRNKVWEEVYVAQAGLIHWPARLANLDRSYFGDKIREDDRMVFRETDVYLGEYGEMPTIIAPTRFVANDWTKVLRYRPVWNTLPSSEDSWLALEDLCVQREILNDIHAVNQLLARFLPVPQTLPTNASPEAKAKYDAEKAKVEKDLRDSLKVKDDEAIGRFMSPYWLLDLAVARSATGKAGELVFRGKLTNRSERRQNVAKIDFKVWLTDPVKDPAAAPAIIPVQSEFVAAGESIEFSDVRVTAASRANRIFAVEQILDLRYAPVKRVERLVLGYLGNRYADQKLVAPEGPAFKEAKDAEGAGAAAAADAPGREGKGAGGAARANISNNGLERDRYLHRTQQVRRMPIGVVLVVDQAHVQDVQRAFANSRLRFQNVQIHWDRFRGALDLNDSSLPSLSSQTGPPPPNVPSMPSMPSGGRPTTGPGARSGPPPVGPPTDFRPGMGRPGGISGPPRGQPGGIPGDPSRPLPDETMTNLVEMTVYGIASLYERFPPRPPGSEASTAASTGGTTPQTTNPDAAATTGVSPPPPPPPPPPPSSPPPLE